MMTFFAPAARCFSAVSLVRNRPVDSTTMSAPTSFHLSSAGSLIAVRRIFLPLTTRVLPSTAMLPLKRPCTESYLQHVGEIVRLEQVVDADDLDVGEVAAPRRGTPCGRCGRIR